MALALGIGANSNIFSFVNAYLVKPLPTVKDTGRLVMFQGRIRANYAGCSYLDFLDFSRESRSFESLSLSQDVNPILIGRGEPERLRGLVISPGFFDVFTVRPILGRPFAESDGERVLLLAYGLWQRRFGGDAGVLGQTLTLDDVSYKIVGVMPPRFRSHWNDVEFWTPLSDAAKRAARGRRNYDLIARLRPGATLPAAQAEIATVASRLEAQYPETNKDARVVLLDYVEALGQGPRESIQVMVVVAAFVLLIACSNVANLQVARATGRAQEIAVRIALGASRLRIIRQVLIESTLLALLGGLAGYGLSVAGVKLLLAYLPAQFQPINQDFLDWRVVLFTGVVALLTGVLSGVAPAFQVSRIGVNEVLKEGGRGLGGAARSRLRNGLVVVELSLAVVLLLAAGLLMQSFVRMQSIDPGFRADHLLAAYVSLPDTRYPKPEQRAAFFRDLVERSAAIPGVRAAAATSNIPLMGTSGNYFVVEGQTVPAGGSEAFARSRSTTPNYFQMMGIALRRGRYFTEQDAENGLRVVIINDRLAKQYFANEEAIGKRLKWGRDASAAGPWLTVVGVVGDVKSGNLAAPPRSDVYSPLRQDPRVGNWVLMRTGGVDPASLAPAFRAALRGLDRDQPISDLRSMERVLYETLTLQRMMANLMAIFGAIALAMAALGIYGVVAYSVAQRTREIGVRIALGAGRRNVVRLVLRQALWMVGLSMAVGVPAAAAMTKLLEFWLYGVGAHDPLTFAAIPLGLAAVALAASYLPARRATQVDPVVALRWE